MLLLYLPHYKKCRCNRLLIQILSVSSLSFLFHSCYKNVSLWNTIQILWSHCILSVFKTQFVSGPFFLDSYFCCLCKQNVLATHCINYIYISIMNDHDGQPPNDKLRLQQKHSVVLLGNLSRGLDQNDNPGLAAKLP